MKIIHYFSTSKGIIKLIYLMETPQAGLDAQKDEVRYLQ